MESRTLKKVLLSLMAVGAAATLSVSGTYSILNAESTNKGSTAALGTLTFGNKIGAAGATCYTNAGPSSPGNTNDSCDALVLATTLFYPGDSASTTVTITNNGSLDISDLTVYMSSCTAQAVAGAGANAGSGDPCSYITDSLGSPDGPLFSIHETGADYCWYPDGVAGSCDPNFSQDDWFGIFAQYINTSDGSLDLGAGPAAGQSRTFTLTFAYPSNADPSLQGQSALFSLAWHGTT